jgi:small conductance mechanosensitive channel
MGPIAGTLTNIVAGIILLCLRPFHVGDYIEVPSNNVSGTVKEIGLFVCQLESFDNVLIVLVTMTVHAGCALTRKIPQPRKRT